ncbi:MAG: hypothetical protein ACLFTK_06695 [Anaerolineales bacterium]
MDMMLFSADHHIEQDDARWRVVDIAHGGARIEVSAAGLALAPEVAQACDLLGARVPVQAIRQVAVQRVAESGAWGVGFFWRRAPDEDIRWCFLLAWPAALPDAAQQAATAAQHIAAVLNVPYVFAQADWRAPVIQLRPLPVALGEWTLRVGPSGLVWTVTPQRQVRFAARVMFFFVAALAFVLLGGGSLRSGLAEVSPEWLPLAAFGIAIVVSYSALENLSAVLLYRRVVVDEHAREVRSERALTHLVDWRVPFEQLDYVLVSQEPARPVGRRKPDDPMQIEQDVWVHLYDGEQFHLVTHIEGNRGQSHRWEDIRALKASTVTRQPLDLATYDTPVHHAALYTGHKLNAPVYVDIR